jgi:hypothetical protein
MDKNDSPFQFHSTFIELRIYHIIILSHCLCDLKNVASGTAKADETHCSRCDRVNISFEGMQFHFIKLSFIFKVMRVIFMNTIHGVKMPIRIFYQRTLHLLTLLAMEFIYSFEICDSRCTCWSSLSSLFEEGVGVSIAHAFI